MNATVSKNHEEKQRERMQEFEAKFITLIRKTTDGVVIIDESGKVVEWNPKMEEITGLDRNDCIGTFIWDLKYTPISPEESPEMVRAKIKAVVDHIVQLSHQEDTDFDSEQKIVNKDGRIRFVKTNSFPIKTNDKIFIATIVQDTTEQNQIKNELIENEKLFQVLLERLPDGVYKSTHDGKFIEVNPAMVQMLGYDSKEELMSVDIKTALYFQPEDRESEVLEEDLVEMGIFRLKKKDGSAIWVEDHGWYTLDDKGEILHHEGIMRDITERKLTEEALKESEERFRLLFEKAPIGYQSIDENGCFLDVNETWTETLGYKKEEIIGQWFGNYLMPNSVDSHKKLFADIKTKGQLQAEFEMRHKNGHPVLIRLEGRAGHTSNGEFKQTHCVIYDITRQRQTEQKITQLLKGIEQSPVSIIITDILGNIEYVNPKFTEVSGYSFEEVKGHNPRLLQTGYTTKEEYEQLWKTITSGNEWRGEIYNKKKNGDYFWESVQISPIRNEAGEIVNYMAIKEDITSRKKSELEIQKLTFAIEQNPASVIITVTSGVIEYVNSKFLKTTGYEREELIGKVIRILKPGHTPDETYIEIWNSLLAGKEWRGEHKNRKKNREKYWESVLISPIKNNAGKITNYVVLSEDISDRKTMERELISAKEKAEESDRLKSAFLANMSHEIRTPLNSILGFSDLMTDPNLDEQSRREFAGFINSSGSNLLSIINDVLDISKIEAGQIELMMSPFSVQGLINTIKNEYSLRAKMKGIELRIAQPSPSEEIFLVSDESRIKQVLINFVGNALKFTEKGSVEIGVKLTGNSVQFHVKDSGIGIPKEFHDRIFDRFRQVESAHTRRYGGNGLGLAITKNLAELLGGQIWLVSEPGEGSTFYFAMPDKYIMENFE
jgi:PAS domain S-box-containing protein